MPIAPPLREYLVTHRAFAEPVVAEAVAGLGSWPGGRALDLGTGAGGALPHLGRLVGPSGSVLAIDLDPDVLPLAEEHARTSPAPVETRAVDAAALDDTFDVIWAGESIWPAGPHRPTELVAHLAGLLRPGGVLAVFFTNYYRAVLLPGRPGLERAVRAASERSWGLAADGDEHTERQVAWLRAAGLDDVRLRVLPRVAHPAGADPEARAYLEAAVWPETLAAVDQHGADLDDRLRAEAHDLLTPGSPGYVLDDPDHYVLFPTAVATGRK